MTPREPPNLILLLCTDQADPVASVLLNQAARMHCEVVTMSLSELVCEAAVGPLWRWGARTIDPSRTAVVNRLVSIETEEGPLESPFQRRQFWTWLSAELQRFAYVSSMPSVVSPIGSFGSLLDQWLDLPELVRGLRVPMHRSPGMAEALRGDVHVVNPLHLYSLGKRASGEPGSIPHGHIAYVRPAGMLFHVAQVGNMIIAPNAPPQMLPEQRADVVTFTRSMAALSGNRILEHAFFAGEGAPVFYSTCPVPVVTGRLPAYANIVVTGLHDDIKNRGERIAA